MSPRSRLFAVLAAVAALSVGTVSAELAAASADGPTASVAKKKKKKKKLKGIAAVMAGKTFNRVIPNSAPTPAGTERWAFCRNGSYTYVKTDYNGDSLYQTTFDGVWKILNQAGTTGVVGLTTNNFVSIFSDGQPAESSPPSFNAVAVNFGPFGVFFGSGQYSFGGSGC
jgi:hypothetical protein